MLNKVSEKFHAWAKGWRVIILFIADALMMGYVMSCRWQARSWRCQPTTASCPWI